jgi:hypothetical protein
MSARRASLALEPSYLVYKVYKVYNVDVEIEAADEDCRLAEGQGRR